MKRKGMGDAALRAVEGNTGGDVLNELAGGAPPAPAASPPKPALVARRAEAPAARSVRAKPAAAPAALAATADGEDRHIRYITASIQMTQEQIDYLQEKAFQRKRKRGGGRADHSAIVRELVDAFIAAGGE